MHLSIPYDHPKAKQLKELFNYLATRTRFANGVEIESPCPVPLVDAEEWVFTLIRDIIGEERTMQLIAQIDTQNAELRRQRGKDRALGILDTLKSPAMIAGLLGSGLLTGKPRSNEWLMNVANDLRKGYD